MSSLSKVQHLFFNSVINHSGELVPEVKQQGDMSAIERIAIYADGYRLRLIEALQDTYPALHTLMGDEDFERLCLDYIDEYPSKHYSIRYFGDNLSHFIASQYKTENTNLLKEMAEFEWALRDAFDATDQSVLTLNDLSHLNAEQWPELKFTPHTSLRHMKLTWNIPHLWKAIEQEAEPQPPEQMAEPLFWVIWRPELETQFRSMGFEEANAFGMISDGSTFGMLCDFMIESHDPDQAVQQSAAYLSRWIEDGFFICELPE